MITLVVGGVRSGKSRFAETHVQTFAKPVTYIATAEAFDDGMKERIDRHKKARCHFNWDVIEAPTALASAIQSVNTNHVILVDCLTLWLNNLIYYQKTAEIELFLNSLSVHNNIVLVSNELGLGGLPADKVSRDFIDQAGLLNQQIATLADEVYFVIAGLAQKIK